ncbi:class V chitinase [Selaginella moellendorffii]|uniref:class V chitinase n=1 Tax=Selaginella moellendorffii TaxID=88036 RepID=UPI000D1C6CE1|nr:class V chitinase [Selaginella moellendorffii]|eukprot:XP_002979075.2 class V chitinase [Selaginella moellendorffii]
MFPASDLSTDVYTHLCFAFANVNSTTFRVEIPVETMDVAREFTSLAKSKNPLIKTLVSIGGAGANTTVFSQMASSSSSRGEFVRSSISLARTYGFDGIDVDWEFPHSAADMTNIASLFSELRQQIDSEAQSTYRSRLLLTAAVYYSNMARDPSIPGMRYEYPVQTMARTLDWANIMCYDYHGTWEPSLTGEHSALTDLSSNLSSSYGIQSWLDGGLPPHKAVMGLAAYGRSWLLANSSLDHGVGAAARGPGPAMPGGSAETGVLFYSEIQEFIRSKNATVVDDSETSSAYAFAGDLWVGFDNQASIEKKVEFLKSKEMRGFFFWTASFDSGAVLTTTASQTLDRESVPPPFPGPKDGEKSGALRSIRFEKSRLVLWILLFAFPNLLR